MGGYQIIDFKNTVLTSGTEATINGVYDAIESTRKMCLVTGLVIGATEFHDFPLLFTVDSTSFKATTKIYGYTLDIVVASDDGVTATLTADE